MENNLFQAFDEDEDYEVVNTKKEEKKVENKIMGKKHQREDGDIEDEVDTNYKEEKLAKNKHKKQKTS